jgi:hypothetical protein
MTALYESLAKQRIRKRQQWLRWRLLNDVGVVLVPQVLMKLADRAVIMENLADDFAVWESPPGTDRAVPASLKELDRHHLSVHVRSSM